MDEMVSVLEEIRDLLSSIDTKLDTLTVAGTIDLNDVVLAVQDVTSSVSSLETTVNFK